MIKRTNLLQWALAALAIFVSSAAWAREDCPDVEAIHAALNKLESADAYHVKTRVQIDEMSAHAEIWGKTPEKLRISLHTENSPGPKRVVSVFDGQYQWIETGNGTETEASKVDLSRTTSPERPFDTGLYIMGTGLLNGESFPRTIAVLRQVYALAATCDDEEAILEGHVEPTAFRNYANARNAPRNLNQRVKRFLQAFGYLRMTLDSRSGNLLRYTLGPNPERASLTVTFQTIELRPTFSQGLFQYQPGDQTTARDITNAVLRRRGDNQR